MSRNDLGTDLKTAFDADVLMPINLCALHFPHGIYRVWTGYGDLYYNNDTYLGVGTFGGVSEIKESTDLAADGVRFTLSGVPTDLLSVVLSERYNGRKIRLWTGAYANGEIVGSAYLVFSGRMDVATIADGAETGTIEMTAESRLVDFERPRETRYTDEEQRRLQAGDTALQHVAKLQNGSVPWGATGKESPLLRP